MTTSGRRTSPASGCSTGSRAASRARSTGSRRPPTSSRRWAGRTTSPPSGSCPTTPRWRCTCIWPWPGSWRAMWRGATRALRVPGPWRRALDFPQGPWSAAYAIWLGSWMWIEADRLDLADQALADLRSSSAEHGFDNWELIAATQTAALEAIRALRSGTSDAVDAVRARRCPQRPRRGLADARAPRVPPVLPHDGRRAAGRVGGPEGARERYQESLDLAAADGHAVLRRRDHAMPGPPGRRPRRGGRGAARRARARPVAGGPALRAADCAGADALGEADRATPSR